MPSIIMKAIEILELSMKIGLAPNQRLGNYDLLPLFLCLQARNGIYILNS